MLALCIVGSTSPDPGETIRFESKHDVKVMRTHLTTSTTGPLLCRRFRYRFYHQGIDS